MSVIQQSTEQFETINFGKSSSSPTVKVIWATIIKELTIWKRYKANMLGGFIEVFMISAVFFIFASAISYRGLDLNADQRFIFFFVGIMVSLFSSSALWTPLNSVNRDLYNGTLEFIYSTPAQRLPYYVGTAVADAIKKFIYVIPMFLFLGFRTEMKAEQWIYASLAILLSVVVFVSLGVIIATTAVMYKQVGSIAGILGLFFDFFAGAYIPVILFPRVFQGFALIFPHAYAYDLVRYYAFDGQWQTLLPIWVEWLLLGMNFLIYVLLSRFFLKRVEKYAKKYGLHLI